MRLKKIISRNVIIIILVCTFGLLGCSKIKEILRIEDIQQSTSTYTTHTTTAETTVTTTTMQTTITETETTTTEPTTTETSAPTETEPTTEETTIETTTEDIKPTEIRRQLAVSTLFQDNSYYCAPAAVAQILKYRGIEAKQEDLAKEMGTVPDIGTDIEPLVRVLNERMYGYSYPESWQAGYRIAPIGNDPESTALFRARVKRNTDTCDPMIYIVALSVIYPEKEIEVDHAVTGAGYKQDLDGNIIGYYLVDPWEKMNDVQFGGLKLIDEETLLRAIRESEEPFYVW